jgi:hypothetical protein
LTEQWRKQDNFAIPAKPFNARLNNTYQRAAGALGWGFLSEAERKRKMRRISISAAVALILIVLHARAFAAHNLPTAISQCGSITHPGNYVLANDLEVTITGNGPGGRNGDNCIIISSSHVNIDLSGRMITIYCPVQNGFCLPEEEGGIGINVLKGANYVSISNGSVEGFLYGIVAQAHHTSVSSLSTDAELGITLNNVSHSSFKNISYTPSGRSMYAFGWMLSVSGGSHNSFIDLRDEGLNRQGLIINNSSYNLIDSVRTSCVSAAQAGPGIWLAQNSNHNSITNSGIFVLFGNGIQVDLGSRDNVIKGNDVSIISPSGFFSMLDLNPNCGSDLWNDNNFGTHQGASPANCIH